MTSVQEVVDQLKTAVSAENATYEVATLKDELQQLIIKIDPTAVSQQTERATSSSITKVISTKPPKYKDGENFSNHCKRFLQYLTIAKVASDDLHIHFLQTLDDRTFSKLENTRLDENEKSDATRFLALYRAQIYKDDNFSIKNDLMTCEQLETESLADYEYRLREKANLAYSDIKVAEENALFVFLRGILDSTLKRKLNELEIKSLDDAVRAAKRIDRANKLDNHHPDSSTTRPILKSTSVSFSTGPNDIEHSTNPERPSRSRPQTRYSTRDFNDHSSSTREPTDKYSTRLSDRSRNSSADSWKSTRSTSNDSNNGRRSPSPYHNRNNRNNYSDSRSSLRDRSHSRDRNTHTRQSNYFNQDRNQRERNFDYNPNRRYDSQRRSPARQSSYLLEVQ